MSFLLLKEKIMDDGKKRNLQKNIKYKKISF